MFLWMSYSRSRTLREEQGPTHKAKEEDYEENVIGVENSSIVQDEYFVYLFKCI